MAFHRRSKPHHVPQTNLACQNKNRKSSSWSHLVRVLWPLVLNNALLNHRIDVLLQELFSHGELCWIMMQPVVVAGCPGEPSIFGLSIKKEKNKEDEVSCRGKGRKICHRNRHTQRRRGVQQKRTAIIAANCCKMDENLRHGSECERSRFPCWDHDLSNLVKKWF